ncbi:MBL fold metallo-hydrolase [Tepidibacter hydrothermalis]|uniref:MBL fold metallo-hydrolase n=1 Tax=Tepidibacter hydrothermalis TaxID=3036126 RepID=A0ABY8EEV3_9FIRM|nr:MBL fold metallo-hydrolase [Tepidibacter hydrothermalis]WFD09253.1 MBL fold metallo-hydrolase [Tepidibacter hydrothermalis]
MFLEKVVAGVYGVNCYILGDIETKKCAVIDPGGACDEILHIVNKNGFNLEYIILTHGHADHIGAVEEIKEKTGANVLAHKEEQIVLSNSQNNLTYMMGGSIEIEADRYLSDGQTVELGNLKLQIIHTPGHTPGGMCIKVNDSLFAGDTLFRSSIGRTDLFGGDYDKIIESVNRLAKLDDNLKVFPGHGPASTIGTEKLNNPYIKS